MKNGGKYMLKRMLADATTGSTKIQDFIKNLLGEIGGSTGFDIIFYCTVVLLLLNIMVAIIAISASYEKKMYRAIKRLNYFFAKNPNINEGTLIAFNNKMKTVPKNLRYCWQEYMLYRDKAPSDYMDVVTCVDQPLKTSSFSNAIKTASIFGTIISILSAIAFLCIFVHIDPTTGSSDTFKVNMLWQIAVVPLLALVVNYLVVVVMKLNKTIVTKELYYSYHDFLRNVNKACLTMPSFVDYEVLFTQREIKNGIPVLQEYLEKKALEEQRAAEDARLNSQEYEILSTTDSLFSIEVKREYFSREFKIKYHDTATDSTKFVNQINIIFAKKNHQ